MDHKSFESSMIDFVNRNAQAEDEIRNEARREKLETAAQRKQKKIVEAVIEYIVWLVALAAIQIMMIVACSMDLIQPKIAIPAASLFTFLAGVRINTLSIRISKYGGRS